MSLAGELFTPEDDQNGAGLPGIVISHPVTSVKEQSPARYAQRLAEKGFAVLTFDAAFQGESEGQPHLLEDPFIRSENVKDAVSFLISRGEVDGDRIGVIGICGSGGYVPFAAATDRRMKAVATVSAVNIGDMFREGVDLTGQDPAVLDHLLATANDARTEGEGQAALTMPLIPMTEEEAEQAPPRSMMREAYDFYRTPRCMHPNAPNRIVTYSIDQCVAFDAWAFVEMIAPRPLLMIVGTDADSRAHSERAIDKAADPKELFWIEGASHVDLYGDRERFMDPAVEKLTEFFTTALRVETPAASVG
ncbi:alpha/beta hydrolase [Streptomyces sp. NPDC090119]|uniref:alpha/beta hydrolase n=1 Tax=Streptomyces sp. NPDC090119 TaxID=3365951 RepID=UPI0038138741